MPRAYLIGTMGLMLFVATACAKVLGMKDAQVEPTNCGFEVGDSCAQQCISQSCCSQAVACMNNPGCSALAGCVDECTDGACESGCLAKYPSGAASYVALADCLLPCECSYTGEGGASGQGGASASGGNSLGGVGGTSGLGSALVSAIARFAEADCNRFQACAPGWMTLAYGNVAECVARENVYYQWIASLPGVAWKASDFLACGTAWATASCADYMNSAPQADCIVSGTVPNHGTCNTSYQCASLFCDSDGTTCGSCVEAPAAGESCISGGCATGLSCSNNGVCQVPRGLREICSDDLPCQSRFDCNQGRCVAPITTTGTACDTTVNLNCELGQSYVCASTTQTCLPVTQYTSPGQTCGVATGNASVTLCSRGTCGDSGLCVARAADHGTCDDSLGPYCEWPAFCSYGICQLESDVGSCQ